ncbi:MAG: histidine kinase [Burkholderiales bacterium RIFCSPLOWO2_02_FULL_57_36]|nr:MAG: histidine kinase [Burkholderiales bacterium RIFCSPLOWO2_02_FULL_57_36]
MLTNTSSVDISLKPRVLIADDSRIVRATLIKHIQGMFEFREALDGEQAWETLLLDPNIRVLITDLTMPKLDGYGLLERIRASKISRIRNMPVVVVSGSDEQEERDRAKAAGATDLITKGIATAQLLSRLDILSKLVSTQQEYEHSLETLVQSDAVQPVLKLSSPYALQTQAEAMLTNAVRHNRNFVLLNVCVGFKKKSPKDATVAPSESVVNAIGQLLQATVRQSDSVAKTGNAEFTLATGSVNFDSARNFAERLCRAIANTNLTKDGQEAIVASCGLVSLCQSRDDAFSSKPTLNALWDIAHRRGALGLHHGVSGVVAAEEEAAFPHTMN